MENLILRFLNNDNTEYISNLILNYQKNDPYSYFIELFSIIKNIKIEKRIIHFSFVLLYQIIEKKEENSFIIPFYDELLDKSFDFFSYESNESHAAAELYGLILSSFVNNGCFSHYIDVLCDIITNSDQNIIIHYLLIAFIRLAQEVLLEVDTSKKIIDVLIFLSNRYELFPQIINAFSHLITEIISSLLNKDISIFFQILINFLKFENLKSDTYHLLDLILKEDVNFFLKGFSDIIPFIYEDLNSYNENCLLRICTLIKHIANRQYKDSKLYY